MNRPPIQTEPRASLRNAIDAKCRDCGAADGGAHWRLHVAVCTVTGCPLWSVRPLPKPSPQWLVTRNPDDLPDGWARKSIDAAIKAIGDPVSVRSGEGMAHNHLDMPIAGDDAVSAPKRDLADG